MLGVRRDNRPLRRAILLAVEVQLRREVGNFVTSGAVVFSMQKVEKGDELQLDAIYSK